MDSASNLSTASLALSLASRPSTASLKPQHVLLWKFSSRSSILFVDCSCGTARIVSDKEKTEWSEHCLHWEKLGIVSGIGVRADEALRLASADPATGAGELPVEGHAQASVLRCHAPLHLQPLQPREKHRTPARIQVSAKRRTSRMARSHRILASPELAIAGDRFALD